MRVNDMEIKSYENMAKLDLPQHEREWVLAQANRLEQSFSALDSFGVSGVEPLVTVLELRNVLREDSAVKVFAREEILAAAPEQYDGYFQVPRTLE